MFRPASPDPRAKTRRRRKVCGLRYDDSAIRSAPPLPRDRGRGGGRGGLGECTLDGFSPLGLGSAGRSESSGPKAARLNHALPSRGSPPAAVGTPGPRPGTAERPNRRGLLLRVGRGGSPPPQSRTPGRPRRATPQRASRAASLAASTPRPFFPGAAASSFSKPRRIAACRQFLVDLPAIRAKIGLLEVRGRGGSARGPKREPLTETRVPGGRHGRQSSPARRQPARRSI